MARAGFKPLVLAGLAPGGLLTTTEEIDNYIGMPGTSGGHMAEIFLKHATDAGATIVYEEATRITAASPGFTVETSSENYDVPAVIFAAGANPKKLGVPGEELPGVSSCATCDGMFYSGDPVAVVGGGESAAEEALYLANLASSVDVFVRGAAWRATATAVAKLEEHPAVRIHMATVVDTILGEDEVTGVRLHDGSEVEVKGVFVAIGQTPNSSVAADHTLLYEDGFIEESTVPGFFVAGDVTNPSYRQVAIAVGDGAKAALDATTFLNLH
jgi:thioredoxin reductase (NADPH)